VALSVLRRRRNTGPEYELLAKYGAKMLRIEAWPEADSCVTEGKEGLTTDPALHAGPMENGNVYDDADVDGTTLDHTGTPLRVAVTTAPLIRD
jgi:hypothetical protein